MKELWPKTQQKQTLPGWFENMARDIVGWVQNDKYQQFKTKILIYNNTTTQQYYSITTQHTNNNTQ